MIKWAKCTAVWHWKWKLWKFWHVGWVPVPWFEGRFSTPRKLFYNFHLAKSEISFIFLFWQVFSKSHWSWIRPCIFGINLDCRPCSRKLAALEGKRKNRLNGWRWEMHWDRPQNLRVKWSFQRCCKAETLLKYTHFSHIWFLICLLLIWWVK